MIILYGSQTGNSIHISKLIQNTILYGYNEETVYNLQTTSTQNYFIDMDSFDITKIFDIKTIIFVCSTHGNGTEPFNMTKFWKLLRNKNLPSNFLSHLNFAIFGLGDSAFKSFNFCSKKLYNCLVKHGASSLLRKGSGDSQDKEGFMTDFNLWIKELYPLIKNQQLRDANIFAIQQVLYSTNIVQKKFLTPPNYEFPVLEVEFDIPDLKNFNVGDCLAIYPENYNQEEFLKFNNIPSLISNVDFNSMPQSHFFLLLYKFIENTANGEIKSKIREIYDNYDLYYDYILLPKRSIFEVLQDFNIKLSQSFILDNIPRINPRYFTLTKKDGKFFITVSLVSYKTRLQYKRQGLCSEYLKNALSIDKVGVISNKLDCSNKKLLFICTGTGITLPRACVNIFPNKEIIVLYGFRHRDKDCLYSEEFKDAKILHAVSRDDKKYVQDVFKENFLKDVDEWSIFVSGNSRLNNIIEKLFFDVYKKKVYFQTETW